MGKTPNPDLYFAGQGSLFVVLSVELGPSKPRNGRNYSYRNRQIWPETSSKASLSIGDRRIDHLSRFRCKEGIEGSEGVSGKSQQGKRDNRSNETGSTAAAAIIFRGDVVSHCLLALV